MLGTGGGPGGYVYISTNNRILRFLALALVGPYFFANVFPRATLFYFRLIALGAGERVARAAGLEVMDIAGLQYDPLREQCSLDSNPSVNYLVHLTRLPGKVTP